MVEGWTLDDDGPLSPKHVRARAGGRDFARLHSLTAIERGLWETERGAHSTARLSPSRRLPVYLNAIEAPSTAAGAATGAVEAAEMAAKRTEPRERGFAADKYWKWDDPHWRQSRPPCRCRSSR